MAACIGVSLDILQSMQQNTPLPAGETLALPSLPPPPPPSSPLPRLHELWDFSVSRRLITARDHVSLEALR